MCSGTVLLSHVASYQATSVSAVSVFEHRHGAFLSGMSASLPRWMLVGFSAECRRPEAKQGKYFGDFLRDPISELSVLSRSSNRAKGWFLLVDSNSRQLPVFAFVQLLTGGL
jgi:hypothetical protein